MLFSNKTMLDDYHNRQYPQVLSSMRLPQSNDSSAKVHLLTSMTEGYKMNQPEALLMPLMQAEA